MPPSCGALNWQGTWHSSPWLRRLLAVVAGLMLALALPRASVAGLAWLAPGLLLFAARGGNAFRIGFLGGITHYLVSLSWLLQIPVRFYPILGWIALACYLALYPAVWVWLCARIAGQTPRGSWAGRLGRALLCAVVWVAVEMAVCRMLTGFPWNLLGATQQSLLPLIQIASYTGVYGVSFLMVWLSVSLLHAADAALEEPLRRQVWMRELALPMLAVAVVYAGGWFKMSRPSPPDRTIRIALIQPSIPQTMIWDPAESGTRFVELLKLSNAALTNKPDLMIWPEAAVPGLIRDNAEIRRAITSLARTNGIWIIIGADDFDFRGTNAIYFNSSFLVSPGGELAATYRKRRLVIFGEYVPLLDWLPFIKYLTPISGGFAAGEKPVTFELGNTGVRTSVLICFEDTFAHYAREHAARDLDFLVNITNDGWFGESAAQWQHGVNAAFRAVENGMPLVRCSNNGITCWIDEHGALRDVGFDNARDIYRAGFKVVDLPLRDAASRTPTFYNKHGDWFGWACVIVAAVPLALRFRDARKAKVALQK